MSTPDLTGTVIVLMHPRTGSSLVMQTLRLLGMRVVGDEARKDLPADANPRGFFEDPGLLKDGLSASVLRECPNLLRHSAVKVALTEMVRRGTADWDACAAQRVRFVMSIRSPEEAFASRHAVLVREGDPPARAQGLFRWSVHNYLSDLAFLAVRWSDGVTMGAPPVCVDYGRALEDPAAYVDRIASAAGLTPGEAQREAAVANIDRELYRKRAHSGGRDVSMFANGLRPFRQIHETLQADDSGKWARLSRLLPAWAVDAASSPAVRTDDSAFGSRR